MASKLMEAARLDRRVTILRAGGGTKSATGVWEAGADAETERWASKTPVPGTERFRSGETAAEAPVRFVFRYDADLVRVTDRLRDEDGRLFDIKSVTEVGRREGWEVLAVARAE